MKLRNILLISVIFTLCADSIQARPRLLRHRAVSTADEGGDNSTAQGVALIQAARCRLGHCGGFAGFEGVGRGNTSDEAVSNCCYWGKRVPAEIGVAVGSDGKFYACVRYQ